MRRLSIATIAAASMVVAFTQIASAADLGRPVYKAPPPPAPVPVYSWTGFYIGGNVGYSASDNAHSSTTFLDGTDTIGSPFTLAPSGWLGGVQGGYNWQFSPHGVLGLEGDWQWTSQNDSVCGLISFCDDGIEGSFNISTKLQWIATVRARLGWAQDHWLYYVTGGVAWGQDHTTIGTVCPDGCGPTIFTVSNTTTTFTNTRDGWVVGGGIEVALTDNWTSKVEYLHVDLGTLNNTLITGPYTITLSSPIRDNIFRVGLNYKFGPVVAGY